MAAVSGAATRAAVTAADPADLVNVATGYPAPAKYPGAVDPAQYEGGVDAGWTQHDVTIHGDWAGEPFTSSLPPVSQAPGVPAVTFTHDGSVLPWDSNAGLPFSGVPGPVSAALHDTDDGGFAVRAESRVIGAGIGALARHDMTGEAHDRVSATQQAIGLTAPAGRGNLDQQQWHDPDAGEVFGPFPQPYAERPIFNNLAYESVAIDPQPTPYAPAGQLPDLSPRQDYLAAAYVQPADPAVTAVQIPQAAPGGIGGGWAL